MSSLRPANDRCRVHNIATGPKNECVLCKREAQQVGEKRGRFVGSVLLAVLAMPLIALAVLIGVKKLNPQILTSADFIPPLQASSPEDTQSETEIDPEPTSKRPKAIQRRTLAVAVSANPPPLLSAAPSALAPQEARKDNPLNKESELVQRAAQRVSVTMYSTPWCGVCNHAKKYLNDQAIPFTDYNVEEDRAAAKKYRQLNPKGGVPTITVDDQLMIGFSNTSFERTFLNAARIRAKRM